MFVADAGGGGVAGPAGGEDFTTAAGFAGAVTTGEETALEAAAATLGEATGGA